MSTSRKSSSVKTVRSTSPVFSLIEGWADSIDFQQYAKFVMVRYSRVLRECENYFTASKKA